MKSFGGPVLFLDRDDINTDEIIPARYLTEITKEDLKPYILEDLKLPGFDPKGPHTKAARVIVSRYAESVPGCYQRRHNRHFHGCRFLRDQSHVRRMSRNEYRGFGRGRGLCCNDQQKFRGENGKGRHGPSHVSRQQCGGSYRRQNRRPEKISSLVYFAPYRGFVSNAHTYY